MKWAEIIKGRPQEEAEEKESSLPFVWVEPKADFDLKEFITAKHEELKPSHISVLLDAESLAAALVLSEQGDGAAADVSRHIFLIMGGDMVGEAGDGSANAISGMVSQVMGGAGVVAAVRRLEEESRNSPLFEDTELDFEEKEDLLNWLHKQRRKGHFIDPNR